jgi:CheY-like chemotaxis protein
MAPKLVFVVDDSELVISSLERMLRRLPYRFQFFTSPRKALEAATWSTPPDVLVTDLRMPEINGLELVQAMSACNYDLSVVVISSNPELLDQAEPNEFIRHTVTKPWEAGELEDAIDRAACGL